MLRYELTKQLKAPFVWVFIAVCVLFDSLTVISENYSMNMIMQECGIADIIGNVDIADADISGITDEYMIQRAGRLKAVHSGFIPPENADGLLGYLVYSVQPFKMSAKTADFIYNAALPRITERLSEINANAEYKYLNGSEELHTVMFTDLLLLCAFEGVLFALLTAPKCAGHEYFSGTEQVIYSTKKGRSLARTKLFAAIVLTEFFFAAVTFITLAVFLIRCPCFELLFSPMLINSDRITIIPWAEMSVRGYFGLNFVGAALVCCISAMTGYAFFGLFVRSRANLFLAAAGALIYTIMQYAVYVITPRETHGIVMLSQPVILLLNRIGSWFAASERGIAVPWFEAYAIAAWGALFAVLCALAIRKIKRVSL